MRRMTIVRSAGARALACTGAAPRSTSNLPGGRFDSVLPQGPVPTLAAPVRRSQPFAMRAHAGDGRRVRARSCARIREWRAARAGGVRRCALPAAVATPPCSRAPQLRRRRAGGGRELVRRQRVLRKRGRAPADLDRMGIRRRRRRDAPRCTRRPRLAPAHPRAGTRGPAPRRLPAVGGAPNAYGVRDLHGLVWEWVDDFNALFIAGDSRTQGDPDTAEVLRRRRHQHHGPRQLRGADAHRAAVVAATPPTRTEHAGLSLRATAGRDSSHEHANCHWRAAPRSCAGSPRPAFRCWPGGRRAMPGDSIYRLPAALTDQDGREFDARRRCAGAPMLVSMFYTLVRDGVPDDLRDRATPRCKRAAGRGAQAPCAC